MWQALAYNCSDMAQACAHRALSPVQRVGMGDVMLITHAVLAAWRQGLVCVYILHVLNGTGTSQCTGIAVNASSALAVIPLVCAFWRAVAALLALWEASAAASCAADGSPLSCNCWRATW
jgi:hypothetical protein